MSAFPSAETDLVTLANWRTAPYNKWAFLKKTPETAAGK